MKLSNRVLALLAMGQVTIVLGLGAQWLRAKKEPLEIADGHHVDGFRGTDLAGRAVSYGLANERGRSTVVVAFSGECIHCEAVAPLWRDWLSERDTSGVDVIALTKDSAPEATSFLQRYGLRIQVIRRSAPPIGSPESIMTALVPRITLFDAGGRAVRTLHGSALSALDSLIDTQHE